MRTFYIFNINPEFKVLAGSNAYSLYKTIEKIYNLKKEDYGIGISMFEQIACAIDDNLLNDTLYSAYRFDDCYTRFSNIHTINNYYNDEQSRLIINKSHLILKSTKEMSTFFNLLTNNERLFACDFQNRDYFWISELAHLTC